MPDIRMRTLSLALLLSLAVGCSIGGRNRAGVEAAPAAPLAGLLAQPLIVLPAHYLRTGDSIGWTVRIPDQRAYLAQFDSLLEGSLRERGAPDIWRFPPELGRIAQRNVGYVANPYQLAAQGLRPPGRGNQSQLTDPLASQLRAWVALQNGRTAILPVEIRFEGTSDSAVAVVRVVVIDARLARIALMLDVRGEPGSGPGDGVLSSLAHSVADLAIPR